MTVITIDAEVLEKEILESKVCTAYSTKNDSSQYVDYKSQGDTRLTINGSRHYKTPFGSLPSVTFHEVSQVSGTTTTGGSSLIKSACLCKNVVLQFV